MSTFIPISQATSELQTPIMKKRRHGTHHGDLYLPYIDPATISHSRQTTKLRLEFEGCPT